MLSAGAAWSQGGAGGGPFHIVNEWKIGGDGGWDYLAVDPQSKLLYVTRGNHVIVVDTGAGKQVADISPTAVRTR
jgi:glucose dehydrogenase